MADVSLDDIIQRRNIRPLLQQRIYLDDILPWTDWTSTDDNSYFDEDIDVEVMGDVRNKIIHNKRLKMVDARDRLTELAKQGDARDRINKMRLNTAPTKTPGQWKNTGPGEKKIRNENRPSKFSAKTQMHGSKLTRTVAGEVTDSKGSRMRGKPTPPPRSSANGRTHGEGRPWDSNRFHPLPNNPHVVTIKNEKADLHNISDSHEMASSCGHERRSQGGKYPSRSLMRPTARPISHAGSQPMPRPLLATPSGYSGQSGGGRAHSPGVPQHLYRPRSPQLHEVVRPTRLKITTTNNYMEPSSPYNEEWELTSRPPARVPVARMPPARIPDSPPQRLAVRSTTKKRSMYEDEEEIAVRPKKVAPLSYGLLARLDQPQRPVPQGYKVLVTNLHLCVSGEDMEELFGTIGPILSARMLRPGMAEAVFVSQEDAYRSVKVFNHRQLDGQPMCVSVIGRNTPAPGPPPHPPASSHTTSILKAASGSVGGGMAQGGVGLVPRGKQKVITPDIGAIHQALFNRSQPSTASNHSSFGKLSKPPVRREVY